MTDFGSGTTAPYVSSTTDQTVAPTDTVIASTPDSTSSQSTDATNAPQILTTPNVTNTPTSTSTSPSTSSLSTALNTSSVPAITQTAVPPISRENNVSTADTTTPSAIPTKITQTNSGGVNSTPEALDTSASSVTSGYTPAPKTTTIRNPLSVAGSVGFASNDPLASVLLGSNPAINPAEAAGEPNMLGDGKRKNVWNLESLRGALGI